MQEQLLGIQFFLILFCEQVVDLWGYVGFDLFELFIEGVGYVVFVVMCYDMYVVFDRGIFVYFYVVYQVVGDVYFGGVDFDGFGVGYGLQVFLNQV